MPKFAISDTLKEYFQKYGPVTSARVIFDYHTGRSRKFGFVEFEKAESMDKVMADPSHVIDGARIHVQSKVHEKEAKRRTSFEDTTDQTGRALDYSEV